MRRALRPVLCLAVLAALLLAPAPVLAQPAAAEAEPGSLAAAGYGDTSLRGTYGTADVFVPIPAGTRARSAEVVLDIEVSPLLVGRSTLTVQAGGVDVSSLRLVGDRPTEQLAVRVPAERIGPDGLALGLRGYLRLTEDDCEESDNPAQWVTIADTSTVTFDLVPADAVLADVPQLFAGPPADGLVGIDVGADPDGAVLQAAATSAWQVGRWRAATGADPLVTARLDDLPRSAPRIAVGLAGDLPDAAEDLDELGSAAGGALAVTTDPAPLLVVAGDDAAALGDAAAVLTRPSTLASLQDEQAVVTGGEADADPDRAAAWSGERTTFAQLGLDRRVVVGTGVREVYVPVDRPAGWTAGEEVEVALDVDASAALRAETSTVQLLVNGDDAGTRPLQPGEGPTRHTFVVPGGLVDRTLDGRPIRALDLLIRMVLDLPEARCSAPEVAAATAAVLPTSTITFPTRETTDLEVGRFPHPLAGEDGTEPVAVVVPDGDLDGDVLDAALQAAAALGRWAPVGAAPPVVVRAGDVGADGAGLEGRGAVVLGEAVSALAGDVLPDDAPTGGPTAAGTAGAVLALTDDVEGGGPALLVTGEGEALLAATRLLGDRDAVQQVAGAVVLVQAGTPVVLDDGTVRQPPPELAPPDPSWLERREAYLVPAVVVGAALLLMLLLVIVLRWRPMARGEVDGSGGGAAAP